MFWLRALSGCMLNLLVLAAAASGQAVLQPTPSGEGGTVMYVSTEGNDTWSGKLAQPNAQRSDGPFATLAAARDAIRKLKAQGPLMRPVTVFPSCNLSSSAQQRCLPAIGCIGDRRFLRARIGDGEDQRLSESVGPSAHIETGEIQVS
jgi:hypothetical protein